MLAPADFFDLAAFEHRDLFAALDRVWDALPRLAGYLTVYLAARSALRLGLVHEGAFVGDGVFLAEGSVVEPGAYVGGPSIIGPRSVVRHGAYVRSGVVVGADCIIGHASEVKNAVFLDGSAAPHFAYVGDSILGNRVNLGAGTKLSNFAMTNDPLGDPARWSTIRIPVDGTVHDTGVPKLGAVLGDDVQLGCNSVTNPGCLVGPRTLVYAGTCLRTGYYGADQVVKLRQTQVATARRR